MVATFSSAAPRLRRLQKKTSSKRQIAFETLESRIVLTVSMTGYEQLLLELINLARANPAQEVMQRAGVSLNQGVTGALITNTPKQPLAPHQSLINASRTHSQDMLNRNFFDHTNPNGESPSDRARSAGYPMGAGENISWAGTTGSVDQMESLLGRHAGLLESPGHRVNLMSPGHTEAGTGVRFGRFTSNDTTYNSIMVTEMFSHRGATSFITGVAYTDAVVDDDFYTIGEGAENILITARNTSTEDTYNTTTGASGGYALRVPNGTYDVTGTGTQINGAIIHVGLVVNGANVKADFQTNEGQPVSPNAPTNGVGIAGQAIGTGNWWVAASTGKNFKNQEWGKWSPNRNWTNVQAADVNGDGNQNMIGRVNGEWWVARSDGSTFTNELWATWSGRVTWLDPHVGDFNADNQDDIIARTRNGAWWVGLSDGSKFVTTKWAGWSSRIDWRDVKVGDFDGDGRDDIVGRANNGAWWVGRSTGTDFTTEKWGRWSTRQVWHDIVVGDFNGDGREEIAGRHSTGRWWVAQSTGSSFVNQKFTKWSSRIAWQDVRVGDLDGDNIDDLLARNGRQLWVTRTRDGKVINELWATDWNPLSKWEDLQIIDLDLDGDDDLFARDGSSLWVGRTQTSSIETQLWGQWPEMADWSFVVAGTFG